MTPTILLAAFLVFAAVASLSLLFEPKVSDQRALKRIAEIQNRTPGKRVDQNALNLKRRQSFNDSLKALAEENKKSQKRRVSVKGQLAQAGLHFEERYYWVGAGVIALLVAIPGFIVQGMLGALIGAFIGALGLPRWILGFLVGRRQKKFLRQFAEGIDMIVRGVKSGLPLNQCLRMIAQESPEPLKSEFQAFVDGQAMGVPFEANLQRLYERMPLPEVNFFNIVLLIQQKTGGNLSETLSNLSTVLRSRKMLKEKVKALSSEARASAMIIGALPFIVMGLVYMVRPDYMNLLFTTTVGNIILLGAGLMMSAGVLIMSKMVNFKF